MHASATNSPVSDAVSPDQLEDRVRRFATTRDSADLFPGVLEADRLAAAREIERVTRFQLAGRPRITLDPSAQLSPRSVAVAAHTTGMGPLLGEWINNGALDTRADLRHVLLEHLEHSSRRWQRMITGALPAF